MNRRLACPLSSAVGLAAAVAARLVSAHPPAARDRHDVRRDPAGTYDVWISHGPEWDTARERITIGASTEAASHTGLHPRDRLRPVRLRSRDRPEPDAGFSFDFDAIEVLNGYQDADRKTVGKTVGDWIGLLGGGAGSHSLRAGAPRYTPRVKLPFDRERMRERNLLDDIGEIELTAAQTPSEQLAATLTLSDLALAFFRGNPDAPVLDRHEDLEEKARLWAAPLKAIRR